MVDKDIKNVLNQDSQNLEEKILKAIFKRNNAILEVVDIINENYFTINTYGLIYKAMLELYKKDSVINIETIELWLGQNNYNVDVSIIKKLYNESYTALKIKNTAEIMKELFQRRKMLENMRAILENQEQNPTSSSDILEQVNDMAMKSNDLVSRETKETKSFKESDKFLEEINTKLENNIEEIGLKTGIQVIDKNLRGLLAGKLFVITADSQVGKSQFAVQLAVSASILNLDVYVDYYSLEMTKEEVEQRALSIITGIEPQYFSNPKSFFNRFDKETCTYRNYYDEDKNSEIVNEFKNRIKSGVETLKKCNFYIDDTPDLTLDEFVARVKKNNLKRGKTSLIIVDHMNILCSANSVSEEVGLLKQGYNKLKQLAKKLDCTVIALHQFSKTELVKDPLRKPNIFALTGGSGPRNFADVICSIWRPEIYRDVMDLRPDLRGYCDIDWQKVRYAKKPDATEMTFDGITFTEKDIDIAKQNQKILNDNIYLDENGDLIGEDDYE